MNNKITEPSLITSQPLTFEGWQKIQNEDWDGDTYVELCAVFTNALEKYALPLGEFWNVEEALQAGEKLSVFADMVDEGIIVHKFNRESLWGALIELDKGEVAIANVPYVDRHTNIIMHGYEMKGFE